MKEKDRLLADVRAAIKASGQPVREIERATNVSKTHINRIVTEGSSAAVSLETLMKLADHYSLPYNFTSKKSKKV